jgi:Na+/proline symporter
MSFKNGFIIGVIAGFVAWVISAHKITLPSDYSGLPAQIYTIAQIISVCSLGLLFLSAFRKKAIKPVFDGFIYGFSAGFVIPTYGHYFIQKQLPPT